MSFLLRLEIGRFNFDSEPWLQPLELEAVVRLLAQHADREPDGSLPQPWSARDGREVVLGWFDGEPVIFDKRGFLFTNIGYRQTDRLFIFLKRLVKEMGCVVYSRAAGEFWTERVLNE